MAAQDWKTLDQFLHLRSRWFTLIGEHLETEQGEVLEYWRVERADSVIILTLHQDHFILPPPMFRPGISQATLDFPGGRVPDGKTPDQMILAVLQKELGIDATAIAQLTPINPQGWTVNSSFSNQQLHGFVAQLQPDVEIPAAHVGVKYPATAAGVQDLLQVLTCLQCRALLLEWWLQQSGLSPIEQ